MMSPAAKVKVCAVLVPVPLVCVVEPAVTVDPTLLVPSNTLKIGTVVHVPPNDVTTCRFVKCPAAFATVEARTALTASVPNTPTPELKVPLVALIVSVIVPEELVYSGNPVAGAPANTRNCEVTEVGAIKQIEVAVLHGATAAEVVP